MEFYLRLLRTPANASRSLAGNNHSRPSAGSQIPTSAANSGERGQQVTPANRIHDAPKVEHRWSVGLQRRRVEIIR